MKEATKDIIEVLVEFTKITPWFKREDGTLVCKKLQDLEVQVFVPDVAKIRRLVQEYYNNIPAFSNEIGFLRNVYQMLKFVNERSWNLSVGPDAAAYT